MREWTETTSKLLCGITAALIALCLAAAGIRVLEYRGLWKLPEALGPYPGILTWVILAFSVLLAMDRGLPREGDWSSRLLWLRRGLLASVFAAVAAHLMLR
jgi:hypothetical protein